VKADSKERRVFVSSLILRGLIKGKTIAEEVLPIPKPINKAVENEKKGAKNKVVKKTIRKKEKKDKSKEGRLDFNKSEVFKFKPPSYKIMIRVTVAKTTPT